MDMLKVVMVGVLGGAGPSSWAVKGRYIGSIIVNKWIYF